MDNYFQVFDVTGGRCRYSGGSFKLANEFVGAVTKRNHIAVLFDAARCFSPAPDQPTARAPMLRITGDLDGFALSFDRSEIVIAPTAGAAETLKRAADEGQRLLAACLAAGREAA